MLAVFMLAARTLMQPAHLISFSVLYWWVCMCRHVCVCLCVVFVLQMTKKLLSIWQNVILKSCKTIIMCNALDDICFDHFHAYACNFLRSDAFTAGYWCCSCSVRTLLLALAADAAATAVQSVVQCSYCEYYKALIITAMNSPDLITIFHSSSWQLNATSDSIGQIIIICAMCIIYTEPYLKIYTYICHSNDLHVFVCGVYIYAAGWVAVFVMKCICNNHGVRAYSFMSLIPGKRVKNEEKIGN